MRILILTCNTGAGHNSCAAAIQEACARRGDVCVIEDALRLVSPGFSKLLSSGHVWIYRHTPDLFRVGYTFTEKHREVFQRDSMAYRVLSSGVKTLRGLVEKGHYDVVLSVHVLSSLVLTELLKRYHPNIITGFVATDYTCSPGGKYGDLDCCFIPDACIAPGLHV